MQARVVAAAVTMENGWYILGGQSRELADGLDMGGKERNQKATFCAHRMYCFGAYEAEIRK